MDTGLRALGKRSSVVNKQYKNKLLHHRKQYGNEYHLLYYRNASPLSQNFVWIKISEPLKFTTEIFAFISIWVKSDSMGP